MNNAILTRPRMSADITCATPLYISFYFNAISHVQICACANIGGNFIILSKIKRMFVAHFI